MSASAKHGLEIDWSTIPAPVDDGAADHLRGMTLPDVSLPATDGAVVSLAALQGRSVIFAYPRTGRPDVALPDGWNDIPGARGCTPNLARFVIFTQICARLGSIIFLAFQPKTAPIRLRRFCVCICPMRCYRIRGLHCAMRCGCLVLRLRGRCC